MDYSNKAAQQPQQNAPVAPVPQDKVKITYEVAGQQVSLSYNIVRNYLTKGEGNVTDADLMQFISICKYNKLNPFLGEAYLVKYGSQPAQMIVSKEALQKRAEANEHYQGFRAGLIVQRGKEILDVEGSFQAPGDELLGAWAEVYRDDRKCPITARVSFAEYSTNKSTWAMKPGTMIRKVAVVQALREAFPAQLGAMYTSEEQTGAIDDQTPEQSAREVQAKASAARAAAGTVVMPKLQPEPQAHPEPEPEQAPQPKAARQTKAAKAAAEPKGQGQDMEPNLMQPGF